MARTVNINISIVDTLAEKQARSAIEFLLSSDVTQKIKAFELYGSARVSNLWMEKLKGPSFPILDAVYIVCCADLNLDLGTLNTATRVRLYEPGPDYPIIMPPSVRYLDLDNIPQRVLIPILYQCPNLEECFVDIAIFCDVDDDDDVNIQFDEPLTLAHLKRFVLSAADIVTTASSAQNLQLPSLEHLQFDHYDENKFINVILLCGNVSSTIPLLPPSTYTS